MTMNKTNTLEQLLPPKYVKFLLEKVSYNRGESRIRDTVTENALDRIVDEVAHGLPDHLCEKILQVDGFSKDFTPQEALANKEIQHVKIDLLTTELIETLDNACNWFDEGLEYEFIRQNSQLGLSKYLNKLERRITSMLVSTSAHYAEESQEVEFLKSLKRIANKSPGWKKAKKQSLELAKKQKHAPESKAYVNKLYDDTVSELSDLINEPTADGNAIMKYDSIPASDFRASITSRLADAIDENNEHLSEFRHAMREIGVQLDAKGYTRDQCIENAKKLIAKAERITKEEFFSQASRVYVKMQLKDWLTKSPGAWIKRVVKTGKKGSKSVSYKVKHKKFEAYLRKEFDASDFDLAPVKAKRVYHINQPEQANNLQPEKILASCIDDYLTSVTSFVGADNAPALKKIEFARRFFANDKDLVLDSYMGALYKDTRKGIRNMLSGIGFRPGPDGRFDEEKLTLEKLLKEIHSRQGNAEAKGFSSYISSNLFKELSLLVAAKSNYLPVPQSIERMKEVIEKFKPHEYTSVFGKPENKDKRYTIKVTSDHNLVKKAARATNESCIRDCSPNTFQRWVSDPGTVFLVGYENGRILGYARLFLMNKHNGDSGKPLPVVALDTIEPPGKNFELYKGLVSAMGLAALQLSLDMNASEFVGEDARIKFGIRQAYSNTQKKYELNKIGRTAGIQCYRFNIRDCSEYGWAHLLMTNWRYQPKLEEKLKSEDHGKSA